MIIDEKTGPNTSGNREESMTESDDDAFGEGKKAVRNQETRDKEASPRESGTVPLGGESQESGDQKGPGGVEGTE